MTKLLCSEKPKEDKEDRRRVISDRWDRFSIPSWDLTFVVGIPNKQKCKMGAPTSTNKQTIQLAYKSDDGSISADQRAPKNFERLDLPSGSPRASVELNERWIYKICGEFHGARRWAQWVAPKGQDSTDLYKTGAASQLATALDRQTRSSTELA